MLGIIVCSDYQIIVGVSGKVNVVYCCLVVELIECYFCQIIIKGEQYLIVGVVYCLWVM